MVQHKALAPSVAAILFSLAACGPAKDADTANQPAPVAVADAWPASLKIVGDGYPAPGDPCRRVGETAATVDLLDDSASLVGCRLAADAARLGGKIVGTVDGITLISVPDERAAVAGENDSRPDAKVAGTDFNATAELPCAAPDLPGPACKAGVKRGPEQIAVEIAGPGGRTRVLLFDGAGRFVTHGSAQADGSAALTSKARREGDWTIVTVGRETYRVPDAFLLGG